MTDPIVIRNRWTNAIIYTAKAATSLAAAVLEAVTERVDLYQAALDSLAMPFGASLVGASLVGASLVGARLDGARLDGASLGRSCDLLVCKGSLVAYADPVGNCSRPVQGFIVEPKDKSELPFLVLRCGCFIGDKKAYVARVEERYGSKGENDQRWRAQCFNALYAIEQIAASWGVAGFMCDDMQLLVPSKLVKPKRVRKPAAKRKAVAK